MASEVRIRAFLALPLAPYFRSDMEPLLAKMRRDYPEVKWVQASEIHVTLHFFGSITSEEVSKISTIVAPHTKSTGPFHLFLGGWGAFPNPRQPRVIWVGMKGEIEALTTLQKRLENEFKNAGFPCEEREFKAHLTLGRIKNGKRHLVIQPFEFGPTEKKKVGELVLFQSHLTPTGAHYEAIKTFPLSTP